MLGQSLQLPQLASDSGSCSQENKTIPGNFVRLPLSLLRYIITYLNLQSLGRLDEVSQFFKILLQEDAIWKLHFIRHFPEDWTILHAQYARVETKLQSEFWKIFKKNYQDLKSKAIKVLTLVKEGDLSRLKNECGDFKTELADPVVDVMFETNKCNDFIYWASKNRHQNLLDYFYQQAKPYYEKKGVADLGKKWSTPKATALHWAAACNQLEQVRAFLVAGAVVNAKDCLGLTPLFYAASGGHTGMCQLLLKNKANPTLKANANITTLHAAASVGYPEIASLLLAAKANPDAATENGVTPLGVAAYKGYLETAKLLLEAKANPNAACTDDGSAPLYMAAQDGHTEIVKLLLAVKANPNAALTTDGATPLYKAAQKGHTEIAKLLLAANANPNAARTSSGITPLSIASQNGHTEIAKLLLETKSNPDAARTTDGVTPLYMAAQQGHIEIAKLLLETKTNPDAARTTDGVTPLYMAAQQGHTEIAKFLLAANANPNAACTDDGGTPLYAAAHDGHTEIAKFLLAANANSNLARASDGATPLYIVAERGHTEIAKLLLAAKANPNAACTDDGSTPLFIARQSNYQDIIKLLLTYKADADSTKTHFEKENKMDSDSASAAQSNYLQETKLSPAETGTAMPSLPLMSMWEAMQKSAEVNSHHSGSAMTSAFRPEAQSTTPAAASNNSTPQDVASKLPVYATRR